MTCTDQSSTCPCQKEINEALAEAAYYETEALRHERLNNYEGARNDWYNCVLHFRKALHLAAVAS